MKDGRFEMGERVIATVRIAGEPFSWETTITKINHLLAGPACPYYMVEGSDRWLYGTQLRPASEIADPTICGKCQRKRKTLYPRGADLWCGTCISREERRHNTREMYGRGRRGY